MSEDRNPKIGDGHAAAMGRQGLRELRGPLYPASNVAQQPEYGLYGAQTPSEISNARHGDDRQMENTPNESPAQEHVRQGERDTDVHGSRVKEPERELER